MIQKVLVANRGEIARRLFRACSETGLQSVGVYTEPEADAAWLRGADEARLLPGNTATETYLHVEALLAAAAASGADAVHPGYGFLSENAAFAAACRDAGLAFVGPTPEAMEALGSKVGAKRVAEAAGVPTMPGVDGAGRSPAELADEATRLGFPVLIKASGGGGGRGMRIVERSTDFVDTLASAQAEAASAFGDDRVLVERYFPRARHVEVQVLGDNHGNVVHLFERECSIQRRYQKIIEESPSPAVDADLRRRMTDAAVALAQEVGYRSAGTVEFLLAPDGAFYLLEVNTRLQVEHPVTEAVTGIDLAIWQLRVAAGQPLTFQSSDLIQRGSAIEARVYAEDPANHFLPGAGTLAVYERPEGPGIRCDDGLDEGDTVTTRFDPMIAKVIAHAEDRDLAIDRLRRGLREMTALGVTTNLPYLLDILGHPSFRAGDTFTRFLETHFADWQPPQPTEDEWLAAAAFELLRAGSGTIGPFEGARSTVPSPWDVRDAWRNAP